MSMLRWGLNLLIGGWGLYNLMPVLSTAAYKTGNLKPVPADVQRYTPLMEATQWWHLGVWAVLVLLLLAASWRIFSGAKAALLMAIATVLDVGLWWLFSQMPAYKQVFTAAELQADYYIMGGLAVATLVTWLTERGK
ncbi:MAG: hypothetical protein ACOY4K_12370 [Pseudomonadota bacterium]